MEIQGSTSVSVSSSIEIDSPTSSVQLELNSEKESPVRMKNWDFDDSLSLIRLVDKHGKNWDKILNIMHSEQHRITHITDHNKVRVHFNGLNDKKKHAMWKEFKPKPFTMTKKKRGEIGAEEFKRREANYALRMQRLRTDYEEAVLLLKTINERESCKTTSEKESEDKIREEMKQKGEEKRAIRNERINTLQKHVDEEASARSEITDAIKEIKASLKRSRANERKLISMQQQYLEWKMNKKIHFEESSDQDE